ncbi:flagellar hook basal-body protein [Rickettsiaceae bacterium]|nr:flagellar hook basal-body protein [Rickettsiaceae bacterium]
MQNFIKKLAVSFLYILLLELFIFANASYANNASYVALSSQIVRHRQLDVIANNAANSNTVGFEQDSILFKSSYRNKKSNNSFVTIDKIYRSGDSGAIKVTNKPTDVAIAGKGYFKLMTSAGVRYTLDGSMVINNQGILVNNSGFPYLSIEGEPIEIPDNFENIDIARSGAVFVNGEEVGKIGVFGFDPLESLSKAGSNMYVSENESIPLEDYVIISGALRGANVNPTQAIAQMVEMQRAFEITTDLMSKVNDMETSAINKLTK